MGCCWTAFARALLLFLLDGFTTFFLLFLLPLLCLSIADLDNTPYNSVGGVWKLLRIALEPNIFLPGTSLQDLGSRKGEQEGGTEVDQPFTACSNSSSDKPASSTLQ
jgi:hypothetical protein